MNSKTFIHRIFRLMTAICACLILSGCTQDGGHIGDWFGKWRMTSVDIDGTPDATYNGNTYWAFQSDIVKIGGAYGNWSTTDDNKRLTLRFNHYDDKNPVGSPIYTPPATTHLPAAISTLDILLLSRTDLTLRYTTPTEPPVTYTYHLQKWW